MLPWIITSSLLFLVIVGLIIERAVSGYLNRKELARICGEMASLRKSNEAKFEKLATVQTGLYVALRIAYEGQERAYKFVAEQIKVTDEKTGKKEDRSSDFKNGPVKTSFIDGRKGLAANDVEWPGVIGGDDE